MISEWGLGRDSRLVSLFYLESLLQSYRRILGLASSLAMGSLALAVATSAVAQTARTVLPDKTAASQMVDSFVIKFRDVRSTPRGSKIEHADQAKRAARFSSDKLRVAMAREGQALRHEKSMSLGAEMVRLPAAVSMKEAARLAAVIKAADPSIAHVFPNFHVTSSQAVYPTDPWAFAQWNLSPASGAPSGWRTGGIDLWGANWWATPWTGAWETHPSRPFVAIIDTGYRRHIDLPMPAMGPNYIEPGQLPLDKGDAIPAGVCATQPLGQAEASWHGMKVQSIINAGINNSNELAGVGSVTNVGTWHAKVMGPCGGNAGDILNAVYEAVLWRSPTGQRNRVINLSLGFNGPPCDPYTQNVMDFAYYNDVLVVVATGNEQQATPSWPANCQRVVSVGAHYTGVLGPYMNASYTNGGAYIMAPGGDYVTPAVPGTDGLTWNLPLGLPGPLPFGNEQILTVTNYVTGTPNAVGRGNDPVDRLNTSYGGGVGTSFSAPHVSAVAAMMFGRDQQATAASVRANLLAGSFYVSYPSGNGYNPKQSGPFLNAAAAMAAMPSRQYIPEGGGGGGGGYDCSGESSVGCL